MYNPIWLKTVSVGESSHVFPLLSIPNTSANFKIKEAFLSYHGMKLKTLVLL